MIHTTIGVYNNDSFKVNGVDPIHLKEHIEYNKGWRPGRALFVDGKCVNRGYLSKERANAWEQRIKDENLKADKCTAPYH